MKRSLSLAALFGAVAVLAAALWFSKSPAPESDAAAGPRAAAPQVRESAAAPTEADPPAAASAAARTELAGAAETAQASAPESVAAVRAQRSGLVVDGPTRTPLADVEVLYEEYASTNVATPHPALDNANLDKWLQLGHKSVRTDAEGGAVLDTRLDRECVVVARAPGVLGRAHFARDGQGVQRIELWPDATLDVLVLGPQGAPVAALRVALSVRQFNAFATQHFARTDDAGRARFEHVGLSLAQHEGSWCVEPAGLFDEQARVMLDRSALPQDVVVLHTTAFGAVELRAWDANGAPLASGMAQLFPIEPGAERGVQRSFLHRRFGITSAINNGVARFEPVRVGGELELAISGEDDSSQTQRIRAPARQGEVVTAQHRDPRSALVLRARLVDEQGAVLAERDVKCRYTAKRPIDPGMLESEQKSDVQGYVRFPLGSDRAQGEERTLEFKVEDPDSNVRSARIELAAAYAPGEHDLGDVRLALPPVVAAGRVVDAQGAPVPRAAVIASFEQSGSRGGGKGRARTLSRGDGSFEVRADWICDEVTLNASLSLALAPRVRVPRGAQGVELVLHASGWIDGRLLLDPAVASTRPRVHARRSDKGDSEDERSPGRPTNRTQVQLDGTFRLEPLEPGRYDLDVMGDQQFDPLVSFAGFDVPSGAGCADPRLPGIDLRGKLTAFRLELVPPDPSDAVLGTLDVQPLAEGVSAFQMWLHDNQADILVQAPAARVAVNVSGFRAEVLERVSSDTRVQLRRGPRVRLKAPADAEIPAAPMFVKASLSPVGSTGPGYDHYQAAVFDLNRELVLHAPGAGDFLVSWSVEKRTENSLSTTSVNVPDEQRITVLESDVEQIFEIRWPAEALAQALKR